MTHNDSQVEAVMALVDNYRHALASVDPWTGSGYTQAGEAYAAIRTALSALAAGKVEAWHPIATAPKDGTEILIWREDCGVMMGRYCAANELLTMTDLMRDELDEVSLFQEDWWCGDADGGGYRIEGSEAPTHWMPKPPEPLPASPSPLSADPESAVVGAATGGKSCES